MSKNKNTENPSTKDNNSKTGIVTHTNVDKAKNGLVSTSPPPKVTNPPVKK